MRRVQVRFLPAELTVEVEPGTPLLEAAYAAGIEFHQGCGGQGTCRRCRVAIRSSAPERVISGPLWPEGGLAWTLACQARVKKSLTVEVPAAQTPERWEEAVVGEGGNAWILLEAAEEVPTELAPVCFSLSLTLPPPGQEDNADDRRRLLGALGEQLGGAKIELPLRTMQLLPNLLRENRWQVQGILGRTPGGYEVAALRPLRNSHHLYGLAVDIGTTTVAAELVNLGSGRVCAARGACNRQIKYGDDVISRIIYASEHVEGLEELQGAVIETINRLVAELTAEERIAASDIRAVVYAGNTTMAHLLLGVPPAYLRCEPYTPAFAVPPPVRAGEIGLRVHPRAWVYGIPGVSSYLGGDVVAGVLSTGLDRESPLTLFLDIGTNGEMVLGHREWLLGCACSAGPAFEGSGVTCGVRAVPGAIEKVEWDPVEREVRVSTIGQKPPVGLCGSGLISALAQLRRAGIVDRTGKFTAGQGGRRLRQREGEWEFVLVEAAQTATGQDVVLTQADIQNLLRAKGAIFAGLRTLLHAVSLDVGQIERFWIAGGFGRYLDLEESIALGLLPPLPGQCFRYVGNTSLKGARRVLLQRHLLEEAVELAERITYLELSLGNTFMEEFVSALFIPHTNLELFQRGEGAA